MINYLKTKKAIIWILVLFTAIISFYLIMPQKIPNYKIDLSNCESGRDLFVSDSIVASSWDIDVSSLFKGKKIVQLPSMASNVLVYGDDIYYTYGSPGRAYRYTPLGISVPVTLTKVNDLRVQEGRIFWRDTDTAALYMSDGSIGGKKFLVNHVAEYCIAGDKIIYQSYDDGDLYSYDLIENKKTCIYSDADRILGFVADEEYIYYSYFDYLSDQGYVNGRLYKADHDGNNAVILSDNIPTLKIYLNGDYIFFHNKGTNGLCRMNKDGSNLVFTNIDESGFVLFDGNIIYRADDAYDSFYVTDLDGKNKVKLEITKKDR
jgi:hypothetical protein